MITALWSGARCRPETCGLASGRILVPLLILGWLALPAGLMAQESELLTPRVSFDGFGTIGVAHSLDAAADFVENPTRGRGTGHTRRIDPALDSRLAGQITLEVGERISGVVQGVVELNTAGEYRPFLEWANLRFAFTPEASVRAGRIVLPMFLVSETRKVSFANPWVRPPVEVYGLVPIYSWDGIDATYRHRFGDWTGSLNSAIGQAASDIPGGRAAADRFWMVNGSLHRGSFTGRAAVASGRVDVDVFTPLFDGFRAFGPAGDAIAEKYEAADRTLHFGAVGTEYDHGSWFTMAEGAWTKTRSLMGERVAGYVTAGYRAGSFTPFATYSRVDLLTASSTAGLPLDMLPPEQAAFAGQLNAGLNTALRSPSEQQTFAVGSRWDVRPGVALKGQVDFIDRLSDSNGTFFNLQPTFEPGGSTQLFSVAATFVF